MASSPQKSPSSPKSPTPKSPPSRKKDDSFLGKLGGTLARRKKAKEGKNRRSARFLGVTSGRGGGWEETGGEERLGGAEEGADGRTRVGWAGERRREEHRVAPGRCSRWRRGDVERGPGDAGLLRPWGWARPRGSVERARAAPSSSAGRGGIPAATRGRPDGGRGGARPAALRASEAVVRGMCVLFVGLCWCAARRGHGALGRQGHAHSLQQRFKAWLARSCVWL